MSRMVVEPIQPLLGTGGSLFAGLKWMKHKTDHSPPTSTKVKNTKEYLQVSRLAAWSKNCKWYSSLQLGAVVLLFCESV
jgi:hypothetical protein